MKKTLFIVLFASTIMYGFSQAKVEIGLKAGANFSNTDVSGIDNDAITSFHGGAYGMIKLANIAIQPEILYSSQGAELSGIGDLDLNYINIPVLVKYYLPLGFNVYAGPQFGILTSAEEGGQDVSDFYSGSDVSGAVGAGLDLPFGLNVTGRYIFGISNISDNPNPIRDEARNNMLQVSVGYSLFKLGK